MLNFVIIGCGRISHKIVDGIVSNKDKAKLIGVSDLISSKMNEIALEYQKKVNSKDSVLKKKTIKNYWKHFLLILLSYLQKVDIMKKLH